MKLVNFFAKAACLSCALLVFCHAASADRITIVSRVGDPLALRDGRTVYVMSLNFNEWPQMNEAGFAAFVGEIADTAQGANRRKAVIRVSPDGQNDAIGEVGRSAPGTNAQFSDVGLLGQRNTPSSTAVRSINELGEVLLVGLLSGADVVTYPYGDSAPNSMGVWIWSGGTLRLALRQGHSALGPDSLLTDYRTSWFNQDLYPGKFVVLSPGVKMFRFPTGEIASLRSELARPDGTRISWTGDWRLKSSVAPPNDAHQFALSVHSGITIPHIDPVNKISGFERYPSDDGTSFYSVGLSGPTIVDARSSIPPIVVGNAKALLKGSPSGNITLVAREGSPIRTGSSEVFFYLPIAGQMPASQSDLAYPNVPMVARDGVLSFHATTYDSASGQFGSGIYTSRIDIAGAEPIGALVKVGDAVPSFGAGASIQTVSQNERGGGRYTTRVGNDGTIVFMAMVSVPFQSNPVRTLFLDSPRCGRRVLWASRAPAAGFSSEYLYGSADGTATPNYSMADNGEVALLTEIHGPGIDDLNKFALYKTSQCQLNLVYQQGTSGAGPDAARLSEFVPSGAIIRIDDQSNIILDQGPSVVSGGRWRHGRFDRNNQFKVIGGPDLLGRVDVLGRQIQIRFSNYLFLESGVTSNGQGSFITLAEVAQTGIGIKQAILKFEIEGEAPYCAADFNSDGAVTVQDIFDFLSLWFAQDTGADLNQDSAVTVQDLFDFLDVWFGGCP